MPEMTTDDDEIRRWGLPLPDRLFEVHIVTRMFDHIEGPGSHAARPDRHRPRKRPGDPRSLPPVPTRFDTCTVTLARPGSKVVVDLRGVPFGRALGAVSRANRRVTPGYSHIPAEGMQLRSGEPVLVARSPHKLFGPFKANMPDEVYRFDGTLIWKRPATSIR